MLDGIFAYEACLMKHHVRVAAWLPLCKNRLRSIRESMPGPIKRRLRYFTFCAVGAIDVLMLDVAKVIRPSRKGFDSAVFFDRSPEFVIETQKRIPGARGFPGDFTAVVLLNDPEEDLAVASHDHLEAPTRNEDNAATRRMQLLYGQRHDFIQCFPFDVINLDLEGFLFRPTDPMPGRLINSMRKIFEWQRRPYTTPENLEPKFIDGFSLMFTTRIGPPNISEEYLTMLRDSLDINLGRDPGLRPIFSARTGGIENPGELQRNNFDLFFKIAVPKVIAEMLIEQDWYIDPDADLSVFEFERLSVDGPYKILHLVMDVKRQNPPRDRRPPRIQIDPHIEVAYRSAVQRIISEQETALTEDNIDRERLQQNLDTIFARRRLYFPGNNG